MRAGDSGPGLEVEFSRVTPRFPVEHLKRTVDFYRDVLGFDVESLWPDDDATFVILDRDEAALQFYSATDGEPTGNGTLYFDVSDASGLARHLVRAGVTAEWGPQVYEYGREEFAVRDPDGYLLIFSTPMPVGSGCTE